MPYEILKAAHLLCLFVWISGMAAAALFLLRPDRGDTGFAVRLDRLVTAPAMGLAWIFGFWLAFEGGWFGDAWLWLKLALVTLLSGVHGALAGRLRRRAGQTDPAPDPLARALLPASFVLLAVIVPLVTTKAF